MTALSTVGVCQQFTLADSLYSHETQDTSWSFCLTAELIGWHSCLPSYLCCECKNNEFSSRPLQSDDCLIAAWSKASSLATGDVYIAYVSIRRWFGQ